MRQRKIKNLDERLAEFSQFIVEEPEKYRGRWREFFGNDRPIWLEIGCGKGKFITAHAVRHPERNYIAIEGHESVVLRALEKAGEFSEDMRNLCFILEYVKDIRELFGDGELAGIYLNFSDPWPKDRHAKRRLTYGKRLRQYVQILQEDGAIAFKTDNDDLFEFTMEQIRQEDMNVIELSRDLHRSSYNQENITTEYEDKFAAVGKNINYVKFRA
ncbi:tRNA (guanosine(46)-N7)-methyltransferase TrmB [Ihubacter sp. mB4P-1]|uniref:tRNA (guanosine(46)-N7)-methyltransferase TrmB n=1 Tax=Ihubacter sp. mB4P-1 TaxID=3242370 RepID=UPI003C7D67DF